MLAVFSMQGAAKERAAAEAALDALLDGLLEGEIGGEDYGALHDGGWLKVQGAVSGVICISSCVLGGGIKEGAWLWVVEGFKVSDEQC